MLCPGSKSAQIYEFPGFWPHMQIKNILLNSFAYWLVVNAFWYTFKSVYSFRKDGILVSLDYISLNFLKIVIFYQLQEWGWQPMRRQRLRKSCKLSELRVRPSWNICLGWVLPAKVKQLLMDWEIVCWASLLMCRGPCQRMSWTWFLLPSILTRWRKLVLPQNPLLCSSLMDLVLFVM